MTAPTQPCPSWCEHHEEGEGGHLCHQALLGDLSKDGALTVSVSLVRWDGPGGSPAVLLEWHGPGGVILMNSIELTVGDLVLLAPLLAEADRLMADDNTTRSAA